MYSFLDQDGFEIAKCEVKDPCISRIQVFIQVYRIHGYAITISYRIIVQSMAQYFKYDNYENTCALNEYVLFVFSLSSPHDCFLYHILYY